MGLEQVIVPVTGGDDVTLNVIDGSTSYITQDDFGNTINEAWLILMAIFVFRTSIIFDTEE